MTAELGLLSVVSMLVIGYCLASALLSGARGCRGWDRLLAVGLAPGLGTGVVSITVLFLIAADLLTRGSAVATITVLAAISGATALHAARRPAHGGISRDVQEPFLVSDIAHARALVVIGGLAGLTLALWTIYRPYGGWDAWAFWNQRALFVLRLGDNWRLAFDPGRAVNVDYPLLLPLTILCGWLFAGNETAAVPIAVAWSFTCGTVLVIVASAARLHSRMAYVAGTVVVGAPFFVRHGAHQFADVPLAYYFLATLALLTIAIRSGSGGVWAAVGLYAGFATWTKNEGAVFAGLIAVSLGMVLVRTPQAGSLQISRVGAALALAGLMPAALALTVFRLVLPSAGYLFEGRGMRDVLEQMISMRNLWPLLTAAVCEVFHPTRWAFLYPPVLILFFGRMNSLVRSLGPFALIAPLLMLLYAGVYLITPLDIHYHLESSLARIALQVWPALVFLTLVAATVPEVLGEAVGRDP